MTVLDRAKLIESHWEDAKQEIKNKWKKITDKDLEDINGSYKELLKKLKNTYQTTEEDIESKIDSFLGQFNLDKEKKRLEQLTELLYANALRATDKIGKSVHESVDAIKDKSEDLQESISTYVKRNVFKSIGLVLVSSFLATLLLRNKK